MVKTLVLVKTEVLGVFILVINLLRLIDVLVWGLLFLESDSRVLFVEMLFKGLLIFLKGLGLVPLSLGGLVVLKLCGGCSSYS